MRKIHGNLVFLKTEPPKKGDGIPGFLSTDKAAANRLYQEGVVAFIGDVTSVSVGDRILYNRAAGHDLRMNGVSYRVLKDTDCAVTLDDEDQVG
jgi:co-chaperonin GroES (HSP10)